MGSLSDWRPSPSMLVSFLALFVALSGTAIAVSKNSIKSGHIAKNAVRASDIKKNQIRARHIRRNQVRSRHVKNGTLRAADLNAATLGDLTGPPGPQGPPGQNGQQGPQGPAGSVGGAAGGDLTGTYPNPQIAPDAVDTAEIVSGAIGSAEILDESIQSVDLGPNSVDLSEIASSAVSGSEIATGAVASAEVLDGSLRRVDDSVFDTFEFIDPPSIAAGSCDTDVLTSADGAVFAQVEVGDVGYTYPLASVANGLMVQTGIRQSVAGQFQYKICNISDAAINDTARVYGVRLVR